MIDRRYIEDVRSRLCPLARRARVVSTQRQRRCCRVCPHHTSRCVLTCPCPKGCVHTTTTATLLCVCVDLPVPEKRELYTTTTATWICVCVNVEVRVHTHTPHHTARSACSEPEGRGARPRSGLVSPHPPPWLDPVPESHHSVVFILFITISPSIIVVV